MSTRNYLAFDLGASSGRALIGRFDGSKVQLNEIHRFPNGATELPSGLHWNALGLFDEIVTGLRKAASEDLVSLGLDTWGVDFGLLDSQGELIGLPYCYRDSRVDGMMDAAFTTVPREEMFDRTGIQFMPFNSVFQLLAMVKAQSAHLGTAETFLTMPDLFNYWMTGAKVCEFSNATTTQCFDPRTRGWATEMLASLGIPTGIFPEVVLPGTSLGPLRPAVAAEAGVGELQVIAPACHDTGSAVAATPLASEDSLYISMGTWALMGAEIGEPSINAQSLAHNFTNEGGVNGTYRFLKNICGLWLVQESQRTWEVAGNALSFDELTQRARQAAPLVALIDPDDPEFVAPGDMPARIRAACEKSGQQPPSDEGAIIRCAVDSLALKCRYVLNSLQDALGKSYSTIHVVGGGIQNTLLCQLIADATGLEVLAGPIEATALGNILVQAIANGDIADLAQGREVVRASTPVETYSPLTSPAWDDAYGRFTQLYT
ncbi:TPA: rhamnulokinase [Candidatus Latescibacteria bacterium]|nr:rhamnulokinase [Candidatus Latescibacterota bacterium]